jgi:hypothetical protein
MKTRLNLTIEDSLLKITKLYAEKHGTSVSELTENYFKTITEPVKKKSVIALIEKLAPPAIDPETDLKEGYYKDRAEKYGF